MGENDYYSSDKTLIIQNDVLIKAFNLGTRVVIPYGVVELGSTCLFNQVGIDTVVIPNSVVKISNSALEGCDNLRNIVFSNRLEYIGRNAFADCFFLRTLKLPESLVEIDFGAFNGCKLLTDVTMHNKIEKIHNAAFIHTRVNNVYFEGTLEEWVNITFSNHLSNPLYKGGKLFFQKNTFRELKIPGHIEAIKKFAFYGCRNMTSLVVEEGVKEIGLEAFARCTNLEKVYLPKTIQKIGKSAFYGCYGIKIKLHNELYTHLKNTRCPVCKSKLPFFENVCKNCETVFEPYE